MTVDDKGGRVHVRHAQRAEPLHIRIGKLRDAARVEAAAAPAPVREQVGLEDASIRVAAGLTGKTGAERRQALSGVQVGNTVTARGAEKTRSTRAEKLTKAIAAFKDWTQDQRDEYIVSDKFEALSDRQQELLSEVFSQLEDRALEDKLGIENFDFDDEPPDVDSIVGDEDDDETDESYVDPVDEAYLNGDTNYYTGEES
jgi:hypothetical protein